MNCIICDENLTLTWSDTHGIGCCVKCGMPYRIYHYDENHKRIEKEPSPALRETGIELAKKYWSERKRRVFPSAYDMGFSGGSTTYSGATKDDCEEFNAWYKAQRCEVEHE